MGFIGMKSVESFDLTVVVVHSIADLLICGRALPI